MKKTVEQYQVLIKDEQKKLDQEKERVSAAQKDYDQASGAFADADSRKRSAEFALQSHKLNKTWMIIMGIALAFDIAIPFYGLYWLKAEDDFFAALGHNGMPAILAILSVVLWIIGAIFLVNKKKGRAKLEAELVSTESALLEATSVKDEKELSLNGAKEQLAHQKQALTDLTEEFYAAYPEELEKLNEEKRQADAAARKEYEDKLASEQKAAEAAIQKQKDLTEAQKMFEHPQAYVMDGQFENEFQVFERSAQMGCQDAQIRVVETYLGISYKSGVKTDVAKGEQMALAFTEEGSFVFYEILGKGFLYGEGGMPKDEAKGLKYLEKAAGKGRQKAMMMAAVCHYNGVGTEKNEERARKFFEHAAKQGNEQAIQVIVAMNNGEKLRF